MNYKNNPNWDKLTDLMKKRIELREKGYSYQEIADLEHKSRSSIQQSIKRSYFLLGIKEPDIKGILKKEIDKTVDIDGIRNQMLEEFNKQGIREFIKEIVKRDDVKEILKEEFKKELDEEKDDR
ncbi:MULTISPECIES: hypothetical protein [unclassified Bacillus (in: firmicutes)]|uniref:hypothetical protein n=1 Tax=unclassified Bacillus (in: firmicutes) TaxID=185979 RepID=UPI000BF04937|nr:MULTISPECIES: hypothetical protein [unclassified Bacillus (in: firmicutes)]PEJ60306.1 hypothetical protein CN692_03155 [Bacillus sp. AFS002410]PEL10682.1 hypothetical protein CN601_13140 [Bacillus sp. AFS017336]